MTDSQPGPVGPVNFVKASPGLNGANGLPGIQMPNFTPLGGALPGADLTSSENSLFGSNKLADG